MVELELGREWNKSPSEVTGPGHRHSNPTHSESVTHSALGFRSKDNTMSAFEKEYKLSGQLVGHAADVRAVCVIDDSRIATGSRDNTLVVWTRVPGTTQWEAVATLPGHEASVADLATLGGGSGLVSASFDGTGMVWNLKSYSPVSRLSGHTDKVCAVASSGSIVVTGSWDATARVWIGVGGPGLAYGSQAETATFSHDDDNGWDLAAATFSPGPVLEGHDGSVLCLALDTRVQDSAALYSGGADKTIRIWNAQDWSPVGVLRGHTDVVRALALVGGEGDRLASVANDTTLRIWSVGSGACLQVLAGHSNLIFALAPLRPLPTPIPEPHVPALVSGSEDKSLRVWALDGNSQTILFPSTVWCIDSFANGDVVVGSADGVARVFTSAHDRFAALEEMSAFEDYAASAALTSGGQAVNLAELDDISTLSTTRGKSDGETKMFRDNNKAVAYSWSSGKGAWVLIGDVVSPPGGKELLNGKYYDVVFEVDADGRDNFKIGYNHGESEYDAATRAVEENSLHPQFIEQIAQFIRSNVKAPTMTMEPAEGESTGWSRLGIRTSSHYPVPVPSYFTSAKGASKALAKLLSEIPDPEAEGVSVDALESLLAVLVDQSRYHAASVEEYEVEALVNAIRAAPLGTKFAGYDLLRLVLLTRSGADAVATSTPGGLVALLESGLGEASESPESGPLRLVALRALVNGFKSQAVRARILDSASSLILLLAPSVREPINVKEALAALQAIVGFANAASDLTRDDIFVAVSVIQSSFDAGNDKLVYRACCALGTFLTHAPGESVGVVADLGVMDTVAGYEGGDGVGEVLADITASVAAAYG